MLLFADFPVIFGGDIDRWIWIGSFVLAGAGFFVYVLPKIPIGGGRYVVGGGKFWLAVMLAAPLILQFLKIFLFDSMLRPFMGEWRFDEKTRFIERWSQYTFYAGVFCLINALVIAFVNSKTQQEIDEDDYLKKLQRLDAEDREKDVLE